MAAPTEVHRDIYDPRASVTEREVAVLTRNGMVVALQPLAAQAGVHILRQGGNAVDAAVAVAATLGVVEPCMSGPMGAGYMVIGRGADVTCLDFCGAVPIAAPADVRVQDLMDGPRASLVPGAVAGWSEALTRFGTLDLQTVLAPAIDYAEDGFGVTPKLARWFERSADRLASCPFSRATFLSEGLPPKPGEVLRQPALAETYRIIARDGADAIYRGGIAARILEYMHATGGWLSATDLGAYVPEWQRPLATTFHDWQVLTPPPPCAGIQTLQTLRLLDGAAFAAPWTPEYLHALIEAIKLARADRVASERAVDQRLSSDYVAHLRGRIDPQRAAPSEGDRFAPASAFTTSFCAADAEGTLVSCTQSLGQLFGAATMAGDTGLLLNDFLWWFDSDPASPNHLAPGKKLDMCLAPTFAVGSGRRAPGAGHPRQQRHRSDDRADAGEHHSLWFAAAGQRRNAAPGEPGSASVHRSMGRRTRADTGRHRGSYPNVRAARTRAPRARVRGSGVLVEYRGLRRGDTPSS